MGSWLSEEYFGFCGIIDTFYYILHVSLTSEASKIQLFPLGDPNTKNRRRFSYLCYQCVTRIYK